VLTLTSSQIDALAEDRLLRTICGVVENIIPHRVPPERNSREIVASLVQLGKSYGVRSERGLARFVCLALIVGEQRLRGPKVVQEFRRAGQWPDALVNRLLSQVAGRRYP
jgi:hypothetical protein